MKQNQMYLYLSCWDAHEGGPGLGLYLFDQDTGEIRLLKILDEEQSFNCSFVDRKRNKLYVNNEVVEFPGAPCQSGRVFIYDLDPETGDAAECMRFVTECPNPAYVSEDPTGRYLFEAHHSLPEPMPLVKHIREEDGSIKRVYTYPEKCVQAYRLDENGLIGEMVDCIDHGSTTQWVESNPHSAVWSPLANLIAVADKGSGYLYLYTFDYENERLKLLSKTLTDVPGAHPRYVAFHPTKHWVYVNHEASLDGKCNVSAFRYNEAGETEKINMVNAMTKELERDPGIRLEQQGFVIDPEGRYLYTVLNSVNAIGVMAIDQESGALTALDDAPVPGGWPRGLTISPNGKYVLATSLITGEIYSYEKQEDGTLKLLQTCPGQRGAAYISFYQPAV